MQSCFQNKKSEIIESEDREERYHIGIIDFLTEYNLYKTSRI